MKNKETNEIEGALIGAILSMPEKFEEYGALISEHYFNDNLNRIIFETARKMLNNGLSVNLVTLVNEFKKADDTGLVTKARIRILEVCGNVSVFDPVSDYIEILKDEYVRRSVSSIITEQTLSSTGETTGNDLASGIIERLTNLIDVNEGDEKLLSASDLVEFERKLYYEQSILAEQGILIGVDTGLESLNDFTGGWQSELIILAGRPSMGKTACALFHGLKSGKSGIYVNCEMSKTQLAQRLILHKANGRIDGRRLKKRLLEHG